MSRDDTNEQRRSFLRKAAAGAMSVPVIGLVGTRSARAEKLDPDNPQAQALDYVHDASQADSARTEGAICGNCMHWTGGDAQWGGCNIFPGKDVNRDGWCSAWVEA